MMNQKSTITIILTKTGTSSFSDEIIDYIKNRLETKYNVNSDHMFLAGPSYNDLTIFKTALMANDVIYLALLSNEDITIIPPKNIPILLNVIDTEMFANPSTTSWELLMKCSGRQPYDMNSEIKNVEAGTVYVDATAEAAVVDLLANVFNGIAYMDPDTVRYNIERMSEGGFSQEDRSIGIELADWFMRNFSLIYTGLIVNKSFREKIIEVVSVELALDDRPEDFVATIREEMKEDKVHESKGNIVLNLGAFDNEIYKEVNAKLADSFVRISEYNDTIDNMSAELSEDDLIDIGYCVSNFAYLFRAFSKNDGFMVYVKSVVNSVKEQLIIE